MVKKKTRVADPIAAQLGSRGGKARVKKLTRAQLKKQMSELGKRSAAKRWGKKKSK